jgi:hypothetical protein
MGGIHSPVSEYFQERSRVMFKGIGLRKRHLNLEIGGQIFNVFLPKADYSLYRGIKREWGQYITDSDEGGCSVEVLPYSQDSPFSWDRTELGRFRKYFSMIHSRFPSDDRMDRAIEESIRLLQHLDPEEERSRLIRSLFEKPGSLLYVRIGSDLFFFDTESESTFFLIQKKALLFSILLGIINGVSSRQSVLMPGFINGMMFASSYMLIRNRGLLLHGSAVQKGGRTVLFLGPSGAGKSTVTRLCEPDICFSDDGTVIRKEDDRVYAYKSPFTQDRRKDSKPVQVRGEVEKIFLLKKGHDHVVLPIEKNEIMHIMLMHLIHFYKYLNDQTAREGFYILKEILDILPVYKLEFAREGEIWDNIIEKKRGDR